MKLCVVGSGYVGLVSGTCFATTGQHVVCVDKDETKIAALERGEIPIFEPGLAGLVAEGVAAGRLSFSTDVTGAIADAEVVVIAVGTPPTLDGEADLSAVEAVAQTVAKHATRDIVLIMKSTVPVGTNARVHRWVKDAPHRIEVVSNPEFLKEGDAVRDFMHPDRIIIGLRESETARRAMEQLYHPLNLSNTRIVWMSPESAELTKYAANTMLAMRISFMNELAVLSEELGADIQSIRQGIGSDSRIGPSFLHAGPGYGGSCFPKDVKALVATARSHGVELALADAANRVNARHRGFIARKVKRHFKGELVDKRICIWGLAFKPGTDDIREAPSLTTIDFLLKEGATITAHDPKANDNIRELYAEQVECMDDPYQAAKGADALVLLTEWRQYQSPDFERLVSLMSKPVVFDGRNIWSTYGLGDQGFHYEGVGVPESDARQI